MGSLNRRAACVLLLILAFVGTPLLRGWSEVVDIGSERSHDGRVAEDPRAVKATDTPPAAAAAATTAITGSTSSSNNSNSPSAVSVAGSDTAANHAPLYLSASDPRVAAALRPGLAAGDTLFVTTGDYGFRHFTKNVVLTTRAAYPHARVAAVMLDDQAYAWCVQHLPGSVCLRFDCPCPHGEHQAKPAEGYTRCLLGIYVCSLRVRLAVLQMGFNLFFVDGDAAVRAGALSHLHGRGWGPLDAVGACETCLGACKITDAHARVMDKEAYGRLPVDHYKQLNIGLFWMNATSPVGTRALEESIDTIVRHKIDLKSVDQTVLNRRLSALGARTRCLSVPEGGLNIKGRSSRPQYFESSWGVHGARLVSRNGFYKKAFLHVNGLWLANETDDFLADVKLWKADPKALKRKNQERGAY